MKKLALRILRKIKRTPQELTMSWKWWNTIHHILNKDGIEFGGPTELFYDRRHRMMLYPYIRSLDGGNIFEDNFFQNELTNTFTYYKKKAGRRFNVDAASRDSLSRIDNTYDFILSSHQIEHIANPIQALIDWKKLLKKNGYVLAILPHKEYTFDHRRPLTTIEHLLEDLQNKTKEDDRTHIQEQIEFHDWEYGGLPGFEELSKKNDKTRVIHHHCFDTDLVKKMFESAHYTTIQCYYMKDGNIVYLGKNN